jgi:PAS domain S-box-containing protein
VSDTATPRVLVVDDNPATLYSTSRVLRAAGFDVREGVTGGQALELASKDVDILLLDVNLPDLHGFEVCRRLRENPETVRLPVIHVSATFVKEIDKAQGLDAGSDGYLTHPVEPTVLVATVNAFLRARRAEDEMRKSEAKFRAVFDNAFSGILLLDEDMTYLDINPAVCRILARSRDEIIGRRVSAFMPPGSPRNQQEIVRSLDEQGSWQGVFPLLKADGDAVQLQWFISAHSFPGVRLAIITDITERLRLEEQRDELLTSERLARAVAERANRLKDEFLGTLSHELRSPLNSILLRTEVLRHRIDNREEVERGLLAIERNTRLQAGLISDLLDVSGISSGKLRLEVHPLNLVSTIISALDILAPSVAAKGLTLKTSFDESIGMSSGDESRLHQVILNLANNAIKFTPSGGSIEVKLERVGQQAKITVVDSGQGIQPELLPHLFERFRQGDVEANRRHGGLGLGLAITKHLVEMHGGIISASSAGLGKGARFTVLLPLFDSSSYSPTLSNDRSQSDGARLDEIRVLVVDDDADACAAMEQILESLGAAVRTALNVADAISELDQFKPQVLVSDLGMPDHDGFELIRKVRAAGYSHQTLPAIAVTALARPEDRRRALLAGYQVHLSKPIDGSELTAVIATLTGRTGLEN